MNVSIQIEISDLKNKSQYTEDVLVKPIENFNEFSMSNLDKTNHFYSIGRSVENKLVLNRESVSRKHAAIYFTKGCFCFIDLGSLSGSYYNKRRVEPFVSVSINENDLLSIGEYLIVIKKANISNELLSSAISSILNFSKSLDLQKENTPSEKIADLLEIRCIGITKEAIHTKTYRFGKIDGSMFEKYNAGQFINLHITINNQEVIRPYTLSSSPSRPYVIEITVKCVFGYPDGLISNWLYNNLLIGDKLLMSGVYGDFTIENSSKTKVLLISAGIGITPMLSIVRWIDDMNLDFDITFVHNNKTINDVPRYEELNRISDCNHQIKLYISLTRGGTSLGLQGRIDKNMLEKIVPDILDREVYVCGSSSYLETVENILTSLHVSQNHIHKEIFCKENPKISANLFGEAKQTLVNTGIKYYLEQIEPELFSLGELETKIVVPKSPTRILVNFSKSKLSIQATGDNTILDIAEQAGILIRFGCRMGSCGLCKKMMTAGKVSMANKKGLRGSEEQDGMILSCVACPLEDIFIEA